MHLSDKFLFFKQLFLEILDLRDEGDDLAADGLDGAEGLEPVFGA